MMLVTVFVGLEIALGFFGNLIMLYYAFASLYKMQFQI